ncbi:NAD-dependent epimerase/dehydratase family protein [Streptomyces sp. NPDC088719]|uniref:NAD-dependent epimerase/dehydratase family protein n=1 Tax=Streptomyces sp. NPDC088719 TaxID=3365872 RepID=UPI0037F981A5
MRPGAAGTADRDAIGTLWPGRRVLVTGATGLLGGWLVDALRARGADVVCLMRDRVPRSRFHTEAIGDHAVVVRGELSDRSLLERTLAEYDIHTVFHLAAQTIVGVARRDPLGTFESNIRGTWNLLEACRQQRQVSAVVVASSDKAYGAQPQLPYVEEAPLLGRAVYDVSKACADMIAQSYAEVYGLPVGVTRCGNLFGGGDLNWSRLVPGTLRDLIGGRAPVLRSDGTQVRDYLYVEDAAAAYLRVAEVLTERPDTVAGRGFNFSHTKPQSVLEMLENISKAVGTEIEPVILGEASDEIPAQYLDSSQAMAELGWEPGIGMHEGLRRTAAWYRAHLGNGG